MCIGAHRCDVPRITITVDDEQNAWLAERADERDRSKSWIASECIDAVRTDAERITPNHRDELTERVDELEERLVNLEADTPTPSEATESRESAPAPEPTERPETNGGARDAATTHGPEDWVGDHLAELDFPNGRERDDCIAAATAAYLFLHERHQASMREIVEQVMPEHPIGYDVPELEPGDRYRGSWWRKIVKPALETLPDVDAPTGGGKWRRSG